MFQTVIALQNKSSNVGECRASWCAVPAILSTGSCGEILVWPTLYMTPGQQPSWRWLAAISTNHQHSQKADILLIINHIVPNEVKSSISELMHIKCPRIGLVFALIERFLWQFPLTNAGLNLGRRNRLRNYFTTCDRSRRDTKPFMIWKDQTYFNDTSPTPLP